MTALFNFSDYITDRTRDFVGREWVFTAIDNWLADPDAPRYFIITGEPGIGKTTIAARLTQIRDLDASHFCVARQADTIDPLDFARTLSHQLTAIDDFATNLLEEQGIQVDARLDVRNNYGQVIGIQIERLVGMDRYPTPAFTRIVVDPLKLLYADGFDRQVVILVDALDEAAQLRGAETIVDLLANARGLPSQVRFVLTSRPEGEVLRHFGRLNVPHLVLDAGGTNNQLDVYAYVRHRLQTSGRLSERLAEQRVEADSFIDRAAQASQGNFLYLVWLLRAVAEGTQDAGDAGSFPEGLDGIYREFLRTRALGQDIQRWQERYRPMLGVLTVAQESLTVEQIGQFTGLSRQAVRDIVGDVEQFLNPSSFEENRYRLYHQSVADFLSDESRAAEFSTDLPYTHQNIVRSYTEEYTGNWGMCSDAYALRHLGRHMYEARLFEELDQLVLDKSWYLARCGLDIGRNGYADDLDLNFSSVECRGSDGWSQLPANALLRATLSVTADCLPTEIYETLVYLDRLPEATIRSDLIGIQLRRARVLGRIAEVARKLGRTEAANLLCQHALGVDEPNEAEDQPGPGLVNLVARFGTDEALELNLRSIPGLDLDRSRACERAHEIACAAVFLGKDDEARRVLLKCLDWIVDAQLPTTQQKTLVTTAEFLLAVGEEEDLVRVLDLAKGIDVELRQVSTLSEIALLFSQGASAEIATKALRAAVHAAETAAHRATLQYEYARIALAMARLGDARCETFLNEAIQLAERPRQPLWDWDETEARVVLAESLARVGLCDEALKAVEGLEMEAMDADGLIVELVKHAQEAKAWELLEKLHPLVWQRSIAVLAHDELFPSSWYDPVIARLEQTLVSEQKLLSRLELMSLIVQVERPAGNDKEKEYLKRMVRELLHSTDKVRVNEIELVISAAEQLSDVDALGDLIGLTKALPEGDQFSRSNTLTRVVVALAHSGATDCAWDLVPAIEDSTKRVEAYVRVCQSTPQTEVLRRERFDVALSFIRSLDNTGWIPNFWGELAVLANQLDLRKERDLCVVKAVAGVERAESGYSFGFNLLNSGYVAQTLDEMGLDIQARQLLRVGLGWLSGESYGSLIGLRHLARTMGRIGVHDLWDDVLTTIREIEKPTERAEALLGTTYAIAHQKDPGQARGLLPEVLDHLVEIPADARLLRGFGEMLCEIGDSGDGLQHELIVRAIARARISDRQTAILWTAGLLHAFAASSLDIAKEAWKRFCRADSVLTS